MVISVFFWFFNCSFDVAPRVVIHTTDETRRRCNNVQVLFPESMLLEAHNNGSRTGTVQATRESVASASSDVAVGSSIKDKAIAVLPTEMAEMAKDTKRKARSSDPGWKYGFWPDIAKKEMVRCFFAKKLYQQESNVQATYCWRVW
jgi:hypothetical protein